MYYYTFIKNLNTPNNRQMSLWDDTDFSDINDYRPNYTKITVKTNSTKPLTPTPNQAALIYDLISDKYMPKDYTTFRIPKHSGGLRTIQAPNAMLKAEQTKIKLLLENLTTPHNATHAYVKGRSTTTALQEHQKNESRWFLKLDIKHFFNSFDETLIKTLFNKVYPLYRLPTMYPVLMSTILELCLLNNELPQGTPASPIITNLCMMPIDYEITLAVGNDMVYTRYADDLLISSKYSFNYQDIINKISRILDEQTNNTLKLNTDKTRYGSSAGRNWNLGLMLNKDNNITIGHKRKEQFKAILFKLFTDTKNNILWSLEDVQHTLGLIAYYQHIEPTYIADLIEKYSQKCNITLPQVKNKYFN